MEILKKKKEKKKWMGLCTEDDYAIFFNSPVFFTLATKKGLTFFGIPNEKCWQYFFGFPCLFFFYSSEQVCRVVFSQWQCHKEGGGHFPWKIISNVLQFDYIWQFQHKISNFFECQACIFFYFPPPQKNYLVPLKRKWCGATGHCF